MIVGYYVHHVGRGHLHRAIALAQHLRARGVAVTGLSSLSRPPGWLGDWVHLARDDDGLDPEQTEDHRDAGGRLHWAPRGHAGLRARTARISRWLADTAPDAVVVDVSVEVVLLVRLHGVPVVSVVLPGHRADPAHLLGFDVADALVGFWPGDASGMLDGVPPAVRAKLVTVGASSRFAVRPAGTWSRDAGRDERRVALLLGAGGHDLEARDLRDAARATPEWSWQVLDGSASAASADPESVLATAAVVVTHAGQNALAEVAALRRPAVVIPQRRPHDEQVTTGRVLARGPWPAAVREQWPEHTDWSGLLARTASLDGQKWASWCDGRAATRFADVVLECAGARP